MSFVTIEDFEVRYGSVIAAQTERLRVEALLADACGLIEDLTDTDYDNESAIPQTMINVAVTAARRAYENPQGLVGETVGNYTWQAGRSGGAGVYLTLAEQRMVLRAAGKNSAVSVGLEGYLPTTDESQYLTVNGSEESVLYFDQEDLL